VPLDAIRQKGFGFGMILPKATLLIACSIAAALCACKPSEPNTPVPTAPTAKASTTVAPETNGPAASETPATPDGSISPEEARNHIGQVATVKGKVFRVHVSQKGDTFIDVGGTHPNAPFTVVAFARTIPADSLQQLDGKVISVKGKIKEYQGKVEIVLDSMAQISE
jgi:DNA/RNA endonuclease YhcR with UshA esterase domain